MKNLYMRYMFFKEISQYIQYLMKAIL